MLLTMLDFMPKISVVAVGKSVLNWYGLTHRVEPLPTKLRLSAVVANSMIQCLYETEVAPPSFYPSFEPIGQSNIGSCVCLAKINPVSRFLSLSLLSRKIHARTQRSSLLLHQRTCSRTCMHTCTLATFPAVCALRPACVAE